jgi:hypothetical protein
MARSIRAHQQADGSASPRLPRWHWIAFGTALTTALLSLAGVVASVSFYLDARDHARGTDRPPVAAANPAPGPAAAAPQQPPLAPKDNNPPPETRKGADVVFLDAVVLPDPFPLLSRQWAIDSRQ